MNHVEHRIEVYVLMYLLPHSRLMLLPLATSNANVKSEPEDDRTARTVQDLGKCSNPDVGIADRERHVFSAFSLRDW
jgi:hypothetical protein